MQSDFINVAYDSSELRLFRKKDVPRHYIKSLDIAAPGTRIMLSTLEGNVEITANPDTYVMIGPCEDVYPITRWRFESQYRDVKETEKWTSPVPERYGWDTSRIRLCRLARPSCVYAKAVPHRFRVYVREHSSFITGEPGDYYAIPADGEGEPHPYIIQADVMAVTYERTDLPDAPEEGE